MGSSSSGGGSKVVCLAAESESEMNGWVQALSLIVAQNRNSDDRKISDRGEIYFNDFCFPHTCICRVGVFSVAAGVVVWHSKGARDQHDP